MTIWSNTDFPYQCLLDFKRTTSLQAAIHATVRKGDIVLDAGAGTGILSFFAAHAGARKVYAVEVDQHLAACLARSIRANGLSDVIQLVHSDITSASLPEDIDVFVCEMMETGLLDELQVPSMNSLRDRNIITSKTRMIPFQYETFVDFGYTDFNYYGYTLLVPKHNWAHYTDGNNGWLATAFQTFSRPHRAVLVDFQKQIQPQVDTTLVMKATGSGLINAVRLSASAHLAKGLVLGATNALNGDKIIPLGEETRVEEGQVCRVSVRYIMGGGLDSLDVRVLKE